MGRASQRHRLEVDGLDANGQVGITLGTTIPDQSDSNGTLPTLDISTAFDISKQSSWEFSIANAPPGLSVNSVTGGITGTISGGPNVYTTTPYARSPNGSVKGSAFTWTVT